MSNATLASVGDGIAYYELGSVVAIPMNFFLPTASTTTANALQPVDPSTITVTIIDPSGSSFTPAAVKDAPGIYHANFTVTRQGLHRGTVTTTVPTIALSFVFSCVPQRVS